MWRRVKLQLAAKNVAEEVVLADRLARVALREEGLD
jgi:hypothetical protein